MRALIVILLFLLSTSLAISQTRTIRGDLNVNGVFYESGELEYLDTAQYLYISVNGNDLIGDGTEANPFKTTKKAVSSLEGKLPHGFNGRLGLSYGAGTYDLKDILPYLERVNSIYALIWITGESIIGDSINITHPGGSTQSYFRYATDSTIVGDREAQFLGWNLNPFTGNVVGYPIAGNTSDSIIMPANDELIVGDTNFFYTLGTVFTAEDDFDSPNIHSWLIFSNIDFVLSTDSSSSSWGTSIHGLSFGGCIFRSTEVVYDLMGIDGSGSFTRCYFDHNSSSGSGDVLEFGYNDGGTVTYSYFHSDNSRALGSQGLEIRRGASVAAYQNIFDGFDEAIKADGGSILYLGATLFRNSNKAIHIHNPPRVFITEDGEPWTAGYDSLHCEDVTEFIFLYDTYDAGRDIYLPHLKAGGYGTFSTQTKFMNNTFDLSTMTAITIGTDGFNYLKQPQLTGSLTDGAPTDAEIDTVTDTTPATVGAGWSVTILDSDGTGLLYRIESDGTNWQYQILTIAL